MKSRKQKPSGKPDYKSPQKNQSRNKSFSAKPAPRTPRPEPQAPKLSIKGQMLFGIHAVYEAILNPDRRINAIYACASSLAEIEEVIGRSETGRPRVNKVEKETLDRVTNNAVHQGVMIDAGELTEHSVEDFVRAASGRQKTVIAILDQVTDPHNVGAIMRSACAFGIYGMVMQKKNAPEVQGVLAKTACGAAEHVPVCYETNLSRTIETLQENGFTVYGFDERGELSLDKVDVPDRSVIVMGAEGPGMRRLVKEKCDVLVSLPVSGRIKSLNVSNAAAIAFYKFGSYSDLQVRNR